VFRVSCADMETNMNRAGHVMRAFLLGLSFAQLPSHAFAQQGSLKERLVGTWSFTSTTGRRPDGTKVDVFGPHPNGVIIFSPDGHFALINTRPGRPKFASGNRMDGTPEEYRATVQGSIAYFGTYTVDEIKSTFAFHIDGSTFPSYEGTDQVRPFTIVGDELRSVNPAPTIGGPALSLALKRAR
jgi:Lipocalin-like domain